MTRSQWKTAWYAILATALLSWIPLNLWLQRHNDLLIHAVISGNLNLAEQAVTDGGNVRMPVRQGFTLLQVAALHTDSVAMATFLVRHGVSPDATNDNGDSALAIALRQGHQQMVAYLRSLQKSPKQTATQ